MVSRDSRNHANPAAKAPRVANEDDMAAVAAACKRGSSTAPVAGGIVGRGTESSYSIMNNTFRVDARYSALKAIGKGSFGIVCSALDEKQVQLTSMIVHGVICIHRGVAGGSETVGSFCFALVCFG